MAYAIALPSCRKKTVMPFATAMSSSLLIVSDVFSVRELDLQGIDLIAAWSAVKGILAPIPAPIPNKNINPVEYAVLESTCKVIRRPAPMALIMVPTVMKGI